MDSPSDVADPTDWLQTPTPQLDQVEVALRCQVCKDFFDTPMITSCSHTFCSLCIRRCLTNDGKCPICRAPDQEVKLRRNCTVEELVNVFQVARPALIQLGKKLEATTKDILDGKLKRKLDNPISNECEGMEERCARRRKTRSQRGRSSESLHSGPTDVAEDDLDSEYQMVDGLTACPICHQRMKEEEVFLHLDIHDKPLFSLEAKPLKPSPKKTLDDVSRYPSSKPPERLPQLNYSLLKETALRKKLTELGIPSGGPKALLKQRHMEWVNLVNANSDSSQPRRKRELLHELDVWDRTQGRQISNAAGDSTGANSVMRKDFDGAAWAMSHDDEFQRLIHIARQKVGHGDKTQGTRNLDNQFDDQKTTSNQNQMTKLSANAYSLSSHNSFHPQSVPSSQSPRYNDTSLSRRQSRQPVVDLEADG